MTQRVNYQQWHCHSREFMEQLPYFWFTFLLLCLGIHQSWHKYLLHPCGTPKRSARPWLWPDPALAAAATEGVNQWTDDWSDSLALFPWPFSLYFCLKSKYDDNLYLLDILTGKSDFIEKEREKKIFQWLVHSPNGHNGMGWADSKLGAGSFFHVSMWVHHPKALGHPLLLLHTISRELDRKC